MNNPDFELALAQTASLPEFEKYLKTTFLCPEAQVAMVKRRDISLFKAYMAHFNLHPLAQCAVAECGDKAMLTLAAEKGMCVEALQIIIARL